MNKVVFSGFMAAAILGATGASAAVDSSSLTTKGYVDAGLRAVNANFTTLNSQINGNGGLASDIAALSNQINGEGGNGGLASDIAALNTQINATSTGLVSRIAAIESDISNINPGTTYTEGVGIDLTGDVISIDGLAVSTTTGNTDKIYVLKNGAAVELEPATTWDSSVLAQ